MIKIESFNDYFLYSKQFKIMIFFHSSNLEFDEMRAFQEICKKNHCSRESFNPHFFNHSVSIVDNLDFQSIKNGIPKDFFFHDLDIKKDEIFFQCKSNSNQILWNLSSQLCYLMVNKQPIINKPFNFNQKHNSDSFLEETFQKIRSQLELVLEKTNFTFIASKPMQITNKFDLYILCNESNFVGCYNKVELLKKELKNYAESPK